MKHRKLFPNSPPNETVVCPDVCDSTCPYFCYPYYPEVDLIPPPTPPSQTIVSGKSDHISSYLIITLTLLASIFLVVTYYVVIVKRCWGWIRPRRTQSDEEGTDEEFLDENQGPAIDHPIWYINTVGLQPSVINLITIFRYKKGDSLIEGTDCSVCLNEFQEDETLRLLPKCNHAFHVPCIDTWLRSHTNCPLCRAGIVSNAVNTPVVSNGPDSSSISPNQDTLVENSEIDGDVYSYQVREGVLFSENRAGNEEDTDLPQVNSDRQGLEDPKFGIISDRAGVLQAVEDSDAKGLAQLEMKEIRRSVSMDSSVAANVSLDVVNSSVIERGKGATDSQADQVEKYDTGKQASRSEKMNRMVRGSSVSLCLHKRPVLMKRSFSYAGRSFFPRHYPSPSSILPL